MTVEGEVQDELAPVALGVTRRLDENYVPAARLANWIVAACLGLSGCAGFVVLAFTTEWPAWAVIGVALVLVLVLAALAWTAQAWPPLEYRRISWRIDEEGIEIRRGVIWRHVVTVPQVRIQHTDVAQGPIQRRFGLATLIVHTAGNHEYEVQLSGLSRPTALGVRDYLLEAGHGR